MNYIFTSIGEKMAKIIKPLTVTQINNTKPKATKSYLSDGNGLRLLIYPNGSKSWLFNYYKAQYFVVVYNIKLIYFIWMFIFNPFDELIIKTSQFFF